MKKNTQANPWKTVKRNLVYSNKFGYRIRDDDVITPTGRPGKYMVIESDGYVVTVPLTPAGQIVMVRQWRYPVEREFLEIPAETMHPGEDPLLAAQRGLKEEAGGQSQLWHNLGSHWLGNGVMKIQGHIFLAQNVQLSESSPEDIERIKLETWDFEEIYQLVIASKIEDYRTKLGVLLTKEFLKTTRLFNSGK